MARTAGKRNSKTKTYDLILEESMALFNEDGIESVSIYRVAESIGISTGNLTYYFKRKTDLIAAHMKQLDTRLVQAFENFPHEEGPDAFIAAYAETFSLSWDYRFLFNGAPYLIHNDLVEPAEYEGLVADISGAMIKNIDQLIKQGLMNPITPPYSATMLVDCIWWNWLGWLRVNQLKPHRQRPEFSEILYNGINHSLFITRPYLKDAFFKDVHRALSNQLGTAKR